MAKHSQAGNCLSSNYHVSYTAMRHPLISLYLETHEHVNSDSLGLPAPDGPHVGPMNLASNFANHSTAWSIHCFGTEQETTSISLSSREAVLRCTEGICQCGKCFSLLHIFIRLLFVVQWFSWLKWCVRKISQIFPLVVEIFLHGRQEHFYPTLSIPVLATREVIFLVLNCLCLRKCVFAHRHYAKVVFTKSHAIIYISLRSWVRARESGLSFSCDYIDTLSETK